MVRGATVLDALDELGLSAQLTYADRSCDQRLVAEFTMSGEQRVCWLAME